MCTISKYILTSSSWQQIENTRGIFVAIVYSFKGTSQLRMHFVPAFYPPENQSELPWNIFF